MSLNPSKSQIVIFTKCPRHKEEIAQRAFRFMLFNENVPIVPEATFLGVTFDSRLTWEPQFRKMTTKAYKRLNLLRHLSSLSNSSNPNTMIHLYRSIIRPIFEYASICIINAADVHLDKFQLLQNQALRVVMKCPGYVSIKDLHDCTGSYLVKSHLIMDAKHRLEIMKKRSPIVGKVIIQHQALHQK